MLPIASLVLYFSSLRLPIVPSKWCLLVEHFGDGREEAWIEAARAGFVHIAFPPLPWPLPAQEWPALLYILLL